MYPEGDLNIQSFRYVEPGERIQYSEEEHLIDVDGSTLAQCAAENENSAWYAPMQVGEHYIGSRKQLDIYWHDSAAFFFDNVLRYIDEASTYSMPITELMMSGDVLLGEHGGQEWYAEFDENNESWNEWIETQEALGNIDHEQYLDLDDFWRDIMGVAEMSRGEVVAYTVEWGYLE